ncbi:MAG: anion permease [Pseudomonadota bacterium]|nr:anion permease [Pseudomonadota bacterium]
MIIFTFISILLVGWVLGKNNLANLFGTAIGTRMVRHRTAEILAALFILIGAFLSGSGTTSSVLAISDLKTPIDILVVLISAVLVMLCLSHWGIPASIVQTIVGSLIGWNIYHYTPTNWNLVKNTIGAWIWAPIIATIISFVLMKWVKKILISRPISLIKRDMILRICLITAGIMASYSLGANNIGTLTGPFLSVFEDFSPTLVTLCVCGSIGIGCLMADKKVIETIGKKLFPLSPTEGFIVMLGTAVSMIIFSLESLRNFLILCHLPTFPLVPVPMSNVIIGAIIGISLTKEGHGLSLRVLGHILISWIVVPIIAGGLSFLLLSIGVKA